MKKIVILILLSMGLMVVSSAQSIVDYTLEFPQSSLPLLPGELTFAGERVPLENYDIEESLRRELLTTSYLHSRTFLTLLATKRFFPIIEPILKKHNVPDDFKYLCMAESGLDPNVRSYAGAAGLWQIMPNTGKQFGLMVEKQVDYRYHVEESTEAACKYLLQSYENLGSWTLAAAAYNLGNAGVSRRVEKQGTSNYYDTFLPDETLRYVFRVLTFKLLTLNPAAYGFVITPSDYYQPLDQYTVEKTSGKNIDWSLFAEENGTSYKMLRQLNHWIRDYEYNSSSLKEFDVKIPIKEFRTKQ